MTIEKRYIVEEEFEYEGYKKAANLRKAISEQINPKVEEMLREQCQAFIDIVNHTEKGENHETD